MQLKQRAVVDIGNVDGVHTFLCVLLELKFKHVLVEKVLQLLIGEVDAPLLKAVAVKVLKAKNVQNACSQKQQQETKKKKNQAGVGAEKGKQTTRKTK